ncbi:MAG TPA: 1,4-dihydroxy-6-naphthoate synthase [Flavipsychrobacter sp.]|nr:1,4-dihydroxy-6-naphthoate synthase [Flavipsychrobacter sp.]
MKLTLGFSPCPNDTFIFDALVNGKIDTKGISFEYVLEDVETLNQWADKKTLDITKLSFYSFLKNVQHYSLLNSGSALGKGVGPLLVSTQSAAVNWENAAWRKNASIAIPGKNTTANLLFSFAFPEIKNKNEIVFSEIENVVLSGKYDAGLIIHESRFTYQEKGLVKLVDLGDWWENEFSISIPLGGIAINRNLGKDVAATIDGIIKDSLAYAWKNYPQLCNFVTDNAQEMDEAVMRKHINLYVNDYSNDLGKDGRAAVETLFKLAKEKSLIDSGLPQIFY